MDRVAAAVRPSALAFDDTDRRCSSAQQVVQWFPAFRQLPMCQLQVVQLLPLCDSLCAAELHYTCASPEAERQRKAATVLKKHGGCICCNDQCANCKGMESTIFLNSLIYEGHFPTAHCGCRPSPLSNPQNGVVAPQRRLETVD